MDQTPVKNLPIGRYSDNYYQCVRRDFWAIKKVQKCGDTSEKAFFTTALTLDIPVSFCLDTVAIPFVGLMQYYRKEDTFEKEVSEVVP